MLIGLRALMGNWVQVRAVKDKFSGPLQAHGGMQLSHRLL